MPAKTTENGEIGKAMVIADLISQGHDIAIPFGHNQPGQRTLNLRLVPTANGQKKFIRFAGSFISLDGPNGSLSTSASQLPFSIPPE